MCQTRSGVDNASQYYVAVETVDYWATPPTFTPTAYSTTSLSWGTFAGASGLFLLTFLF